MSLISKHKNWPETKQNGVRHVPMIESRRPRQCPPQLECRRPDCLQGHQNYRCCRHATVTVSDRWQPVTVLSKMHVKLWTLLSHFLSYEAVHYVRYDEHRVMFPFTFFVWLIRDFHSQQFNVHGAGVMMSPPCGSYTNGDILGAAAGHFRRLEHIAGSVVFCFCF